MNEQTRRSGGDRKTRGLVAAGIGLTFVVLAGAALGTPGGGIL